MVNSQWGKGRRGEKTAGDGTSGREVGATKRGLGLTSRAEDQKSHEGAGPGIRPAVQGRAQRFRAVRLRFGGAGISLRERGHALIGETDDLLQLLGGDAELQRQLQSVVIQVGQPRAPPNAGGQVLGGV